MKRGVLSYLLLWVVLLLVGTYMPQEVFATTMTLVSDVIDDPTPSGFPSHDIQFTVTGAIPLGGKIIITPEAYNNVPFDIPAALDYTDVDLLVATGSNPYISRPLAATAGLSSDGVAVVSGTAGSITITLGNVSLGAISSGTHVEIKIGSIATNEAVGDQFIQNPSVLHSYRIRIMSFNASNAFIEQSVAMIALANTVSVGPIDTTDVLVPIRSNGMPTGELLGSTQAVQVSLITNKEAICHYDTIAGLTYPTMSATMTAANYGLLHYFTVLGLTPNTGYGYYIRCVNTSGAYNTDDYPILFNVGDPVYPGSNATNSGVVSTSPENTGTIDAPQGASSFSGPGPAGGPFLAQGQVTIDGDTFPSAKIVYLQDGKIVKEDTVDSSGHFNQSFTNLDRGTYTWGMYVKDPREKVSGTYNSTIYLIGNTNNIIAPVYLSPTISAPASVGLGENITVDGYAIAKKTVQVILNKMGDVANAKIITATTTASDTGKYTVSLPTETLPKGTYEVKSHTVLSASDFSIFSPIAYVGVGESPKVDFSLRADLNKDKKVNLVDFSILLYNWKTSDPVADINQDGIVSLTDFSIMLANWTG